MDGLGIGGGIARSSGHTGKDTRGLAGSGLRIGGGAGAVDEGILLSVAKADAEALRDITGNVKSGVVQKLVADLDHAAQLVRGEGLLRKGHIRLLNGGALLDPGSGAGISRQRDDAGAGVGVDGVRQGTEDVVLLKALDELALEFIGDGITAVLVDTHRQCVTHLQR